MSDVMLLGVLRMPYEMAMSTDLSRRQFYDRAQQAATAIEEAGEFEVRIDALQAELDAVYAELRKQRPAITAVFDRDVWDRVAKWSTPDK